MAKKRDDGPMGLGDPEDYSLRRVEKDVLIANMIRDRARIEKCIPEVAAFSKCSAETGLANFIKCRQESNALRDCLKSWYENADLRAECTKKYLEQRRLYRLTGEKTPMQKVEHRAH